MSNQNWKKILWLTTSLFLLVALGSLVGGVWVFINSALAQNYSKKYIEFTPKISVLEQKDSPLQISSTYVISSNGYSPEYRYLITSKSDKIIRAFTIQIDTIVGKDNIKLQRFVLNHLTSESLILQSYQSKQITEGGGSTYSEVIKEIILSVDFVEFADGSTWGKDSNHSAEILSGQRAGGKDAIDYFNRKIIAGEFDLKNVEDFSKDILEQNNSSKSKAWKRGYEIGVGIVRNRVITAHNKSGIRGVEDELQKPFDASEGRKNR